MLDKLIGVDVAVFETDDALAAVGDGFVVCDHDDCEPCPVEVIEHVEDVAAGFGVEVAGRFVCEEEGRFVDEGAGDGDTLHLAA